jgi:predicted ATPase
VLKPTLCEEDGGGWSGDKWPETYAAAFQAKAVTSQWFLEYFGRHLLTYLSTEHRLQLVKESRSASFKEERANLLQEFYYSGKKPEQQVREIVREEFGQEIALDFSVGQKLLLRVANDFSSLPADPREALPVLSEAAKLDEQGDGIRSFVGMVVAVLAVKRDVILIDEPEAFLHPPQAFRIGEFLSEQANQSRQFIVATHSADVLRGILAQRHSAVSIIRLDRVGDKNSFSILEPNRVRDLVTDPILTHLVS